MAIIPARGGSKGLPGKNIKHLCGKPLINYSIEAALKSDLIDYVLVSTDDEEIAGIAREAGAEVPFLRPSEYAQDKSSISDAVQFTLEELSRREIKPSGVVILYPTHPFRPPGLLDFLIEKMLAGYSPVLTVKKISHRKRPPLFCDTDGKLRSVTLKNPDGSQRRETYFRDYGLFSGFLLDSPSTPYVHKVRDQIELIDIDSAQDFHLAEAVVQNNLFEF